MIGQLIRFLFVGGFLTLLYAVVYSVVIRLPLPMPPNRQLQFGNLCGYLVAMLLGYVMHSRLSFRGHGRRGNLARTGGRFFAVSLVGLSLNSFWVWLFVEWLDGATWWPMPFMLCVTPLAIFYLNRRWVFA